MNESLKCASEVLGKDVKLEDLSLSGLSRPNIDWSGSREEMEREEIVFDEYRKKYGKDWLKQYVKDMAAVVDYDAEMKDINTCILYGTKPFIVGGSSVGIQARWDRRCHEIYGNAYDELIHHDINDGRVVELLLQDAARTGKWKELPDELQRRREETGAGQ